MHPHFKATNQQLLTLLECMDVILPKNTSPIELEKKLLKTLDVSQRISDVPRSADDGTVDISSFPPYDPTLEIAEEVRRTSFGEAMRNNASYEEGKFIGKGLYEQPFYDLRQTLMAMGMHWDKGCREFIISDKTSTSRTCVHLHDVRKVADKTPLIVMSYRHDVDTDSKGAQISVDWMSRIGHRDNAINVTTATVEEQHLLLRLLSLNKKRVPASYTAKQTPDEKKNFSLSFLLPIGPIGPEKIGSLNMKECAVCGEYAKHACGGCRSVRYCSKEHATSDWKAHKATCRSLVGVTWTPLTFSASMPFTEEGTIIAMLNHHASTPTMLDSNGKIPPNPHGTKPFIIKAQMDIRLRRSIMIYDEKRTMQVYFTRATIGNEFFDKLDKMLWKGRKDSLLYFWAKRTGELEFSLALDRLPEQTIPW